MLRELAPDLYVREGWLRFYGVRLETRMTVLRLPDGKLFVHSPTALVDGLRPALEALGDVAYLVSPNKLHHRFIGDYAAAFPRALVFAPPGLRERRPDLRIDRLLGDSPEPEWEGVLDQAATGGNAFFTEILFFHRASRTLIAADLLEDIQTGTTSAVGRAFLRLIDGFGRPVPSPEFRLYTLDADAAARGLARLGAWDYERIIISHGPPITSRARETLEREYAALLARVRGRGAFARGVYGLFARLQ